MPKSVSNDDVEKLVDLLGVFDGHWFLQYEVYVTPCDDLYDNLAEIADDVRIMSICCIYVKFKNGSLPWRL